MKAFLFDNRRGDAVESWAEAFRALDESQVLWLDLTDSTDDDQNAVFEATGIARDDPLPSGDIEKKPRLRQQDGYLHVRAVAVSGKQRDASNESVVIDCFVGANWIVTVQTAGVEALVDFREIAVGEGEIGILDAPSFLSALLEWVVTSYLRAFDEIEATLEEFRRGRPHEPEQ